MELGSKHVLVTGGAGYIGSHACKKLLAEGYIPVTVDNFSTGWRDAVKFGPIEEVNLLDRSSLSAVFESYRPCAVMHFAAHSLVSESVTQPAKYWRNNVLSSLNLFEACAEHACRNIIFSSTCAIYGDHDSIVLNEDSEQRPSNAYGASKRAVEEILQHMSSSFGLRYVIFRYFNVAGADPEGELGEFHRPETHLIPLILDAISGKREALTIFGTDWVTPDGTCIRDYVHVCDVVDAHIMGLKWLEEGNENQVFNLGTGVGFSVREVVEQVKLVTNRPVPIVEDCRRPGDRAKLVSGSTRANALLGWSAHRSNLKQMINDAWRWHQNGIYYG